MITTTERALVSKEHGKVTVRRENDTLIIMTGGQEITLLHSEISPTILMLGAFLNEIDADKPAADGGL